LNLLIYLLFTRNSALDLIYYQLCHLLLLNLLRITILQGICPYHLCAAAPVEKMWFELGKQFSQQGHRVCQVSRPFPGLPPKELIEGVRHVRVQLPVFG
jgi:hypothetical protein